LLLSTVVGLYGSRAKQSREDLNELEYQAKVTLPTANHRAPLQRHKEKGNSKKMTNVPLGLIP